MNIIFGILLVVTCTVTLSATKDANSTVMKHRVSPKNFRNGTSKIVNGYQAQLYQFPYYLRLLGYRNEWQDLEDYNYECGAVLISLGWSITAAHCFYAQNYNGQMDFLEKFYVIAGTINRGDQHSNVQDRVIMSEYATPHRKYSHETLENDIGILKIPVPFLRTAHVNTIALPSYNFNIMDYVGEVAVASGFGLTSTNGPSSYDLQYAYLDVITRRECKETFIDIPQSAFCCKDSEYDSSICQGDSGGPITLYDVNNRITVVGVSSFTSEKCGVPPQGFTDVARFRPFIKEVTGL
uniref:Putative trypsin-like serine protease n=1 Tax=Nyssomyia neivai TaxID=330878 RepID=A0A1L8DQT0_9DIPT